MDYNPTVFIDGDGCPVIDDTIKLAREAGRQCVILCDTAHYFERPGATTITVSKGKDSVDFALVNKTAKGDVVVTQDYGLAAMCLAKGAIPIRQDGLLYDEKNIDYLLMQRYTAQKIRKTGKSAKGLAEKSNGSTMSFKRQLWDIIAPKHLRCKFEVVTAGDKKSQICRDILQALPNWFGLQASIDDYVEMVEAFPFYAIYDRDTPVGFVSIKVHSAYTAEIYVAGILEDYHRYGLGRKMVKLCDTFCRERKIEFLTVKTLAESHPDEYYKGTRLFYEAVGFKALEVFPLLWDENNPCLMMVKRVPVVTIRPNPSAS